MHIELILGGEYSVAFATLVGDGGGRTRYSTLGFVESNLRLLGSSPPLSLSSPKNYKSSPRKQGQIHTLSK